MIEQYYYLIFGYLLVSLIIALFSFISLNNNLRLLANRKLRNDKVFIRANIVLHKETLNHSIVWPYLLIKMAYRSWKLLCEYYPKIPKTAIEKKQEPIKESGSESVLPPRSKPKQMTRRNRSE